VIGGTNGWGTEGSSAFCYYTKNKGTVKKYSRFATDDSNKIGLKGYNEGNDEICMCYNTS
jgi:hypothetical protein